MLKIRKTRSEVDEFIKKNISSYSVKSFLREMQMTWTALNAVENKDYFANYEMVYETTEFRQFFNDSVHVSSIIAPETEELEDGSKSFHVDLIFSVNGKTDFIRVSRSLMEEYFTLTGELIENV